MTMISMTTNHGFPILIGDILVSSILADSNLPTPSFMEGIDLFTSASESRPYKLKRKLYVINDQLCVALGGNVAQMFSFLNSLNAFYSHEIPTPNGLKDYLKSYSQDKIDKMFAILILAEEVEGRGIAFHPLLIGNIKQLKHPLFDLTFVGGSGISDFEIAINTFSQIYGEGNIDDENKALSQNLILLSIFLGHETASANSLINKWGAGFEIITYKNGKFTYVDDFTFVLVNGSYTKNEGLRIVPFRIMKYTYMQELLIILANDFKTKEMVFGVSPITKEKEDYPTKLERPDYNSPSIIVYFLIKLENGLYATPCFASYSKGIGPVILRINEGYLEFLISESTTKYIENTIKTIYLSKGGN